eukprot:TRINITY_DN61450_c0_g1_i1.p1 TRINITY_DN61450_c0_g1~~TRINITY_DN61450_c0_g1_i1.p1  ORF type:complete len:291 (+),score=7.22 TRINITY_DN61450_c0_g1_i1:88-873(+)
MLPVSSLRTDNMIEGCPAMPNDHVRSKNFGVWQPYRRQDSLLLRVIADAGKDMDGNDVSICFYRMKEDAPIKSNDTRIAMSVEATVVNENRLSCIWHFTSHRERGSRDPVDSRMESENCDPTRDIYDYSSTRSRDTYEYDIFDTLAPEFPPWHSRKRERHDYAPVIPSWRSLKSTSHHYVPSVPKIPAVPAWSPWGGSARVDYAPAIGTWQSLDSDGYDYAPAPMAPSRQPRKGASYEYDPTSSETSYEHDYDYATTMPAW